ncbi:MAG: anhydro-N-acetylmuramic acid kinase [Bacteroidia bacterium]|nr:anhydro-N-acetylmuramic acid kinase [Bacteroidia bacterium]MCZ2249455.1 anhydro-N-acetylmuramic acid kinase [Bacteroidia bacterium]
MLVQKENSGVILGVMSGTSLDGVDIAACTFNNEQNKWHYEIIEAETFAYTLTEKNFLKNAYHANGVELIAMHHQFGNLLAEKVLAFCKHYKINAKYIASHGHTIFHQPQKGYTFQLGHGANIAAQSGINTICDFRTSDVAYKGQGAPLVPIGDKLLFNQYDYCLNLGGISNISFNDDDIRKAFDIGICNMALNELAQYMGLDYDHEGHLAQSGMNEEKLLASLKAATKNQFGYYKSLGYEWYEKNIRLLVMDYPASIQNKLRTVCEFIAYQINSVVEKDSTVLVSGGGAKNNFLMECIRKPGKANFIVPDKRLIDFKEAVIFAFLGWLRINQIPNALSSVTGAVKDSCGGCIYLA